jgi:hypothetical protein
LRGRPLHRPKAQSGPNADLNIFQWNRTGKHCSYSYEPFVPMNMTKNFSGRLSSRASGRYRVFSTILARIDPATAFFNAQ